MCSVRAIVEVVVVDVVVVAMIDGDGMGWIGVAIGEGRDRGAYVM